MIKKSIAMSGGRTAGHIYPLVVIGNYLNEKNRLDIQYFGSKNNLEYEVAKENHYTFKSISPTQIRTKNIIKLIWGLINFKITFFKSLAYLLANRPSLMLVSGGYTCAPVGLAAKTIGIPLIVFCPDIKPGWSIRFLSKFADQICCSVSETLEHLSAKKTSVTGYPARKEFYAFDTYKARLKIQNEKRTNLLIMGGSLGSEEINQFVLNNIKVMTTHYQITHITGINNYLNIHKKREKMENKEKSRYSIIKYANNIAELIANSDLILSRAGASIFGELTALGQPAILYPGLFSDQYLNAKFLEKNNAAIVLENLDESAMKIIKNILDSEDKRIKLANNIAKLSYGNAVENITKIVIGEINE
tara:strand:+ start:265 stop:1347 length:1083 start_codon:yes stop_codon:yes gene_type:complete